MAPWGTHFCQFYGSRQDVLDLSLPYLRAGLEGGEQCIWRTHELSVEEALQALDREFGDVEKWLASRRLIVISSAGWYGPVLADPEQALAGLEPRLAAARARGHAGIRSLGNVPSLSERAWDVLMGYEADLNRVMLGRRIVGMCTYSLDRCDASQLLQVLVRHQFALIKHEEWTLIEPSEQKRATAAVEQMNRALAERTAELQGALAELRGFSRWVTHDLRAPVRSVRSFGDLLAETALDRLDEDERDALDRIRSGMDRMDALITDILAYSTSQQDALRPQRVDLAELARQTWDTVTGGGRAGHARLEIRPIPEPVLADRAMLAQVLANLFDNAVKFTRASADPRVELGAVTSAGECAYYVRDNGIGFDDVEADRIFGAFERLHGRAAFEGSGLGLTIARQIIARHGGRIWARSAPGEGATFFFTLHPPEGVTAAAGAVADHR